MIELQRYAPSDSAEWDSFVRTSRNGTFLHERAYMDYHADRMDDHSLMLRDARRGLLAVMPAHVVTTADGRREFWSHRGLTYGGLLLADAATAVDVMTMLSLAVDYARGCHCTEFYYKQVPDIYRRTLCQEEDYALWRQRTVLWACNLSVAVDLRLKCGSIAVERRRLRGQRRAESRGVRIDSSADLAAFWPIMTNNLMERYGARPVHTLEEMQLLQSRFPERIRCCVVWLDGDDGQPHIEAGAVLYQTDSVVHVQYGHATPRGKQYGALDALYLHLIDHYRRESAVRWFDFGTSNEQDGRVLNESLVAQKEGFGARGSAHRIFRLAL